MGAIILTLTAFGGIGNLTSLIRYPHCHNINLLLLYLAPTGMDTTYDLEVFSPNVDITVAGHHGLTLGILCYHANCFWMSWLHIVPLNSAMNYFCCQRWPLLCHILQICCAAILNAEISLRVKYLLRPGTPPAVTGHPLKHLVQLVTTALHLILLYWTYGYLHQHFVLYGDVKTFQFLFQVGWPFWMHLWGQPFTWNILNPQNYVAAH